MEAAAAAEDDDEEEEEEEEARSSKPACRGEYRRGDSSTRAGPSRTRSVAVRRRCNFPSSRGLIGWRSIDERGDRGENAAAAGVSCRRRRGDAGPWKEEEAEAEEEEEDAREGAPGRGLRGELGMFFLRSREILLCNKSELNVKRQDAKNTSC